MTADVRVTVAGGVAHVEVHKAGLTVEVRDYDVDGADEEPLWTDENGDECVRYFVTQDGESTIDQQSTGQPDTSTSGG